MWHEIDPCQYSKLLQSHVIIVIVVGSMVMEQNRSHNTKQNDSNYFQHLFMSAATKELPRAKLQVNLTSH